MKCSCAKESSCKAYLQGQIFHRGVHKTRLQIAEFILSRPEWRGAVVTRGLTQGGSEGGEYVRAVLGTAEIWVNTAKAVR